METVCGHEVRDVTLRHLQSILVVWVRLDLYGNSCHLYLSLLLIFGRMHDNWRRRRRQRDSCIDRKNFQLSVELDIS